MLKRKQRILSDISNEFVEVAQKNSLMQTPSEKMDEIANAFLNDVSAMYTANGALGGTGEAGNGYVFAIADPDYSALMEIPNEEILDLFDQGLIFTGSTRRQMEQKLSDPQEKLSFLIAVSLGQLGVEHRSVQAIGSGTVEDNLGIIVYPEPNQTLEDLSAQIDEKVKKKADQFIEERFVGNEMGAYQAVLVELGKSGLDISSQFEVRSEGSKGYNAKYSVETAVKGLFDELAQEGVSKPKDVKEAIKEIANVSGANYKNLKKAFMSEFK